jgi:glucose/arabinose dehydrogenase
MTRWFIIVLVALMGCSEISPSQPPDDSDLPDTGPFEPIGRIVNDATVTVDGAQPGDADPATGVDEGVDAPTLRLKFVPIVQDSSALRFTDLAFIPDSNGQFIAVDKDGDVFHMQLTDDGARTLGRFNIEDTYTVEDSGLISVTIDPRYADNGFFYLGLSISRETNVIRRYRLLAGDYPATYASQTPVIEVTGEGSRRPWHNVGSIGFTDDGYLWALFGDKVLDDEAQNPASPLGKLLRIIPSHEDEGGYRSPVDNPYNDGSGHPAVYALGLRSPWKGTYHDGRWFISDVGLETYEEVNLLEGPAQNFGWPLHEGPCAEMCGTSTPPWIAYGRGSSAPFVRADLEATAARKRSAWVGVVYKPNDADPYRGLWNDTLVFGDMFSGFVRARPVNGETASVHVGHLWLATSMAQGPDGYVYATGLGTWPTDAPMRLAPIYRVELKDAAP